jgi:hypothetical protein
MRHHCSDPNPCFNAELNRYVPETPDEYINWYLDAMPSSDDSSFSAEEYHHIPHENDY